MSEEPQQWNVDREAEPNLLGFPDTDAGNAEAFAFLHGDRFRYDHDRGIWRMWNGSYWTSDETGETDRAALQTVRARRLATCRIGDQKLASERFTWALQSESVARRRNLLDSARTIQTLATTAAQYDADSLLLNVENGTVDLRTGILRHSDPEDLLTKHTAVPYSAEARCPRWLQFLQEIFQSDSTLIDFVWRAVGYSMTGLTEEQCFFVLYGTGANGKSTFLETLIRLLGSYAATSPFSAFLLQKQPGAPRNDIARLTGTRLVKASESHSDATLDEAVIKEITGGDTITARFLFREFFDFKPQFKLWLATNYKPRIIGTDDAIWRRVRLIPFERQFMGGDRDPYLGSTLEREMPGILAWAVRGCLAWHEGGLGSPPAVTAATTAYREESDTVGRFVADCCYVGPDHQAPAGALHDAYTRWCEKNGHKPDAPNKFANKLAGRGFDKRRTSQGFMYRGLEIAPESAPLTPSVGV